MKLWYGERKHPLLFVYVTLLMFYQWCDFWGFEINVDMIQYKICMHVYTASVALNIALLLKTEKKLSVWIFDFSRVTWLLWIMMHMHTYIHHYHYRHNWLTSTGMIYKWRGRESANQWLYEYKYLDRLYLVRKLLNWVKQIHHTAMNFQRHLPPRILRSTFHVFTVCITANKKRNSGTSSRESSDAGLWMTKELELPIPVPRGHWRRGGLRLVIGYNCSCHFWLWPWLSVCVDGVKI